MIKIEYQQETITKVVQCADLLVGDLREAYKAYKENPVVGILLLDLIGQGIAIKNRLNELAMCPI